MFMRGFVFRMIALALFAVFLTAGGYVVYQAGATQAAAPGAGAGLSPLALLCGAGLLFFAILGGLTFAFCPFRKRGRMNSQVYDS
jgi:hypothetical protein